jgi:hypothetical protein
MAWDYEADADVPDETLRAVCAEVAGTVIKPLSPEEIALREVERETRQELYRQQQRQWRLEHEQEQAAKAAQEQAEFLKEHRQREAIRQRQRAVEIDREVNRRGLMDLRLAALRQDTFRQNILNANANAVRQQNISHILSEINAMVNPPAAPEPSVVVVNPEPEDDEFCGVKVTRPNPRRSWW